MKSMLIAAGLVGLAVAGLVLYAQSGTKEKKALPQGSRGAFAMG